MCGEYAVVPAGSILAYAILGQIFSHDFVKESCVRRWKYRISVLARKYYVG